MKNPIQLFIGFCLTFIALCTGAQPNGKTISGADNDDCSEAVLLRPGEACTSGTALGALLTGPAVQCPGKYIQGIWYKYESDFDGQIAVITNAQYNDALTVFEGSCANLAEMLCDNRDEFGFEGERSYVNVTSGKTYYFRIAKQIEYYGRDDQQGLCIAVEKRSREYPVNDGCANSMMLTINTPCVEGSNLLARFDQPIPSLNSWSRADIWFSFTPTTNKPLEIISHANFADVLTVYKGNCANLNEVKCEDLGGRVVLLNPTPNASYYLQVSGYFSTLEGKLCLEIIERNEQTPANEDCVQALPLELGRECTTANNFNAKAGTIKSKCMVFAAPDIWYSFVAPQEREVAVSIASGFLYHYALYGGNCNALSEISCGPAPDPCQGPLVFRNLTAGAKYYLQIANLTRPIHAAEADICIRVDAFSLAPAFDALSLEIEEECLHGILGRVSYSVTGGIAPILYTGPAPGEIFLPGTEILAFVEDAAGCRDFKNIRISCAPPAHCAKGDLGIQVERECLKDSIGRATGEVLLRVRGTGGSGAYFYYGTSDSTVLRHGDRYQAVIIDSDSCYVVEEGQIDCPPFDCSQSKLSVQVQYECIDTLLRARLEVNVGGNLGNYTLQGNRSGDLLEQGAGYSVNVTDDAGCSTSASGFINCHFDSCAFARPELSVDYTCVTDTAGNRTGLAIMHIDASSFAGGIVLTGHQDGDTLRHGEMFLVTMADHFGCTLQDSGTIDCVPVANDGAIAPFKAFLYPNPAGSTLHVYLPEALGDKCTIALFDHLGRMHSLQDRMEYQKSGTVRVFDTGSLQQGLYLIRIAKDEFYTILRFIKT
ncbi:MAG: T9SS type A sorting domain-containing protein [Saprospiraceae bacterium]|nr:T9SS type A sorting domain-containing protein [Saprospiraceae bacterium]